MQFNIRLFPFCGQVFHCLFCQKKIQLILGFIFFQLIVNAQQQDAVQFMAYNLLNYPDISSPSADTSLRNPHYRTILSAANPDILVVEEMNSQWGVNIFLSNVLNANSQDYAAGSFVDGPDTDNGIFYKTAKFVFVNNRAIQTNLRNISEFTLLHILSGDTIRIYAVHLKASSGSSNEAQRAAEADSLRKITNALPAGSNFIVCGDFNFYSSSESAYQKLLQVQPANDGHFIDPIPMTGIWNSASFSAHHTQSTRIRAFGGGSTGGLDDRFDLILYSNAISIPGGVSYRQNSCVPYGNDGNHYNDSINKQPNTAVPIAVANALHNASDHLPVCAVFNFEIGGTTPADAGLLALISPLNQQCGSPSQVIRVQVKNYGSSPVDFVNSPLQIQLNAVNPSFNVRVFNKIISTGSLAGGAVMTIAFDSTYDMSLTGTYSFSGYSVLNGDTNASNDYLATTTVLVTTIPAVSVSPNGPFMICNGSVTLTATAGDSYLWSNSATTSSILVSDTGRYREPLKTSCKNS
ncbi:MAG TPA: endonuclease/exonuclease/phosphatase family protein [Bacteroidia bacterium]|nr:endonuclease/exonuclease/phosphatase family protein [Bacteroidia bacterium]